MSPLMKNLPTSSSLADLLKHLGGINARRVRLHPAPGSATVQDVINIQEHEDRLYELIDGVLVEKIMGIRESFLAAWLIQLLGLFVKGNKLGILTAPDGAVRLGVRLVRIPDVSYFSWDQFPHRRLPDEKVPELAPRLAIEVLSDSNTPREMKRKLKDYFFAEVRFVWFVDPKSRSVEVFTAPDESTRFGEKDTLDGGAVLPGFTLPVATLFEDLPEEEEKPRRKKPKKRA
jgi:Uma2 family endonuclease